MEFSYEIDRKKALVVSKESIIYGYKFREEKAKKAFVIMFIIGLFGLVWILVFHSLFKQFSMPLIALFVIGSILALLLYFRAEHLQILALQSRISKLYKKKDKMLYSVFIDNNQLSYISNNQSKMSFSLKTIKHITYRDDLNGILFTTSKLARFVFFVDLSVIDTKAKEKIFNILLENLNDKNAQQELKKSLL